MMAIKIFILIAIILVSVLVIFNVFFGSHNYHAIFNNVNGLKEDNPVFIKNVKVGNVKEIDFQKNGEGLLNVKLNIDKEVNIPDKSIACIGTYDPVSGCKAVYIKLLTSNGYLENGDTILTESFELSNDSVGELSAGVNDTLKLLNKSDDCLNKIEKQHLCFKVQILVSAKEIPKDSPEFKGLQNVEMYSENGLNKYVVEKHSTLERANYICKILKDLGFKDAFVVAFYNEKRISIKEAKELLRN